MFPPKTGSQKRIVKMERISGNSAGVNHFPGSIHTRDNSLAVKYQAALRELLPSQLHKGHVGRAGSAPTQRMTGDQPDGIPGKKATVAPKID